MVILLAILSVISSLLLVFVLVALGWYLVWKLFLSRFRFVRELIGGMQDSSSAQGQQQSSKVKPKRTRLD